MMIGEVLAKNKYICLLTSPLLHALQHEIINLIYLFVFIVMCVYLGNRNNALTTASSVCSACTHADHVKCTLYVCTM